jgi:hypothetical protein
MPAPIGPTMVRPQMGPQTKARNAVEPLDITAQLASQSPHIPVAINQPHAAARAPATKNPADITIGATFHNTTSNRNTEGVCEEMQINNG